MTSDLQAQADDLSARFPPGTPCTYWTLDRCGPGRRGAIRWPWSVLGGHTVVAWIAGCVGCVAASHVECDRKEF